MFVLRVTFGVLWWILLASHIFVFSSKDFIYSFKLMAETWCMNFGWVLLLLYSVWLILPLFFFFPFNKYFLTVCTFLLFSAKLFRNQKSQTSQRKPFLLSFLMARMRTYEKSLRMFLPKLFLSIMQVGKMVNVAVWWRLKPPCCQVNWLFLV